MVSLIKRMLMIIAQTPTGCTEDIFVIGSVIICVAHGICWMIQVMSVSTAPGIIVIRSNTATVLKYFLTRPHAVESTSLITNVCDEGIISDICDIDII